MLVSDIMTLDPKCCTPECTAQEAAVQMRQWSVGSLPVVKDVEGRKLVGIVTDRDLCMGVVAASRVPAHVTVRECMTRDAISCNAGEADLVAAVAHIAEPRGGPARKKDEAEVSATV